MNTPIAVILTLHFAPIIGMHGLPTLDALVMSGLSASQGTYPEPEDMPIYLDPHGFYWASQPFFDLDAVDPYATGLAALVKGVNPNRDTFDGLDMEGSKTKANPYGRAIDTQRGDCTTSIDTYPTLMHPRKFTGGQGFQAIYFAHGDRGKTDLALQCIHGIGKRAHMGWGAVTDCEVVEWEGPDYAVMRDGQPTRPIPLSAWSGMGGAEETLTDLVAIRPPYRYTKKQECAMPPSSILTIPNFDTFVHEGAM